MKRTIFSFTTILMLIVFSIPLYSIGQQWIPLNGNNTPQKPTCIVSESGDDYLIIDV